MTRAFISLNHFSLIQILLLHAHPSFYPVAPLDQSAQCRHYRSRLAVVRRAAKKLQSARPIKRHAHYCELFTCRDGIEILALNYATSLNRFVLRYVIKKNFFRSSSSSFLATGTKRVFRHISLYISTLRYI